MEKPKQWKQKQRNPSVTVTFVNWKAPSVCNALSLL